jgi:hypothetical protein
LPIDADGRGADKAQPACLLFGLDLDNFHFSRDAFLGHDLVQALECKVVRRTVFIVKEVHSQPGSSKLIVSGLIPHMRMVSGRVSDSGISVVIDRYADNYRGEHQPTKELVALWHLEGWRIE